MTRRLRFAPSPTGPLHIGHAYSAGRNAQIAADLGAELLIRIDDLDQSRARTQWEELIFTDMDWLGLQFYGPVVKQSQRSDAYHAALTQLWDMGLLYACTCTRRDIEAALSAPQEGAPLLGPDGLIYPGTCRNRPRPQTLPTDCALRLDMARAAAITGDISFADAESKTTHHWRARALPTDIGDVVIMRRGMAASYHLSTVVDDHDAGITDVCRGQDLQEATAVHIILQRLLGYQTPSYWHHRLIRDETGKRLAKRDDARAISTYRDDGYTPADIWTMVGLTPPWAA